MVDVGQLVDPELEGLLRELGSRPRSVFLRSSRKDALRVLRSRTTERVSALAVPDALERELVTVHRAELAEILKEACRTRLLEGERERLFNIPFSPSGQPILPTPLEALEVRLERTLPSTDADAWPGLSSSVRRTLARSRSNSASVFDLAALGQKLQPSDVWRLMATIACVAEGELAAARVLAESVLSNWPREEDAFRALEVLGLCEVMDGDYLRGIEHQESACGLRGDYPVGQMNRLKYALLALQERTALDASERLDSLVSVDHPVVHGSYQANLARRQLGLWSPSADSIHLVQRLKPRLGRVAKEVTRVFAE